MKAQLLIHAENFLKNKSTTIKIQKDKKWKKKLFLS
tara:strand:- start:482 stop:589 length:108 start_codon:yes stop_codon:yes gene_type:complete